MRTLNIPNLKSIEVKVDVDGNGKSNILFYKARDQEGSIPFSNETFLVNGYRIKISPRKETDLKIIKLHQSGKTQSKISEEVNVSQSTVSKFLKDNGYGR